ncbi:MAG: cysteine--tRNA ligase [Myxococcales bacterium]|nr:cysteine--tRNA ligase [Myxococcales bacterium]
MIGANPDALTIYNTLSRSKERFVPMTPGRVTMYVCGVTVYDYTHIGHARTFVAFDVITRYIRALGFDLTFVRNHTDVDDKIIARAAEVGEEPLALAERFIAALDEDMGALGVLTPDVEPKVSTHIDAIIAMVETLIERGMAYAVEGGDVFYRVERFEGYGKLSGQRLEGLRAGGRIASDPRKESPHDFALWKSCKPGEPSWESPWGAGRPGWHIECSAMSCKHLGDTFDIHGGGNDLVFPHHENEIAQSEGATGAPFARYWMHSGMVNVMRDDDQQGEIVEKMSKSLGNFWTVRDVLGAYHPEVVRYFMLTTHYRQPITYSLKMMEEAHDRLEYLYTTLSRINEALGRIGTIPEAGNFVSPAAAPLETFFAKFHEAMCDDFNVPAALVPLGELAKASNELTKSKKKPKPDAAYTLAAIRSCLVQAGQPLGILQQLPEEALVELRDKRAEALGIDSEAIEQRINDRSQARQDRDWSLADAIRDELAEQGIELMDGADGTSWRIARVTKA